MHAEMHAALSELPGVALDPSNVTSMGTCFHTQVAFHMLLYKMVVGPELTFKWLKALQSSHSVQSTQWSDPAVPLSFGKAWLASVCCEGSFGSHKSFKLPSLRGTTYTAHEWPHSLLLQPKSAGPDDFISFRDDPQAGQMLTVNAAQPGTRTHLVRFLRLRNAVVRVLIE